MRFVQKIRRKRVSDVAKTMASLETAFAGSVRTISELVGDHRAASASEETAVTFFSRRVSIKIDEPGQV